MAQQDFEGKAGQDASYRSREHDAGQQGQAGDPPNDTEDDPPTCPMQLATQNQPLSCPGCQSDYRTIKDLKLFWDSEERNKISHGPAEKCGNDPAPGAGNLAL